VTHGYHANKSAAERRVEKLEEGLDDARQALLSLLSDELQAIIREYRRCATWDDLHEWERRIVEHVLGEARILGQEESYSPSPRAFCPLCGGGSSAPYQRGFLVPEGLERHLQGLHNARQCLVTKVVFGMALEELRPIFRAANAPYEAERQRLLDELS